MKFQHLHSWNITYHKAIEIQEFLRTKLKWTDPAGKIQYVAGVDASYSKRAQNVWAGAVVMAYPDLEVVDQAWVAGTARFPYIPGLLSFRELPLLLQVLRRIRIHPHIILCDGQGIAHPRRMGLASHLGLLTETPTIGCAKTRLVGTFHEVGYHRGAYSFLRCKGETLGAVLRTREGTKPLFISPGHATTLEESIGITLSCTRRYRQPEPLRKAHLLANRQRQLKEPC